MRGDRHSVEAFWSKVDVRGLDECWPFKLKPLWNGYCTMRFGSDKKRTANAIAYELSTGDILEKGFVACHECDNRRCCNPLHLFKGTYSDNTKDMHAKGRGGRASGRKLTLEQAQEIRGLYAAGATQVEIAERFGIAAQNISMIVQGKSYTGKPRNDWGWKRRAKKGAA